VITLDARALNRALLARQLLLTRQAMPVPAALHHLTGLQTQEPQAPYIGLWSRLAGFAPDALATELTGRRAVRTWLMRRTLHLVTAGDCLAFRSLHQPMLQARMRSALARDLTGVDQVELAAAATPHFEREPVTLSEVARLVGTRWPGVPPRTLGNALSSLVPLVQVPPRGVWGRRAPARVATVTTWLGRPLRPASGAVLDELVLRYLTAFGPAAGADVRTWCGLAGVRDSLRRLRPRLRTFRDVRGRELFDVPDGPLPDPETPAPPRFLPAFDNAVLGFDDRTRIIDDGHRALSMDGARLLLVDGRVAGTWTLTAGPSHPQPADEDGTPRTWTGDGGSGQRLRIDLLTRLSPSATDEVVAEGERLLAWCGADAPGTVVLSGHSGRPGPPA
jgi:Winged helix DNA-binding domain